ncbi:MAG: hypothetical protein GXY14_07970 [Spirochaetes bacterium]|nr:hypothetical protein [Spirochaetota bacterium]
MFVRLSKWFASKLYYLSFSDRLHYWSQWSGILICITLLLQLHRYNGIGSYIKYEFYVLLPVMALPLVLQCMALIMRYIIDYDGEEYFEAGLFCVLYVPLPAVIVIHDRFKISWTDQYTGSLNFEPFAILIALVALSVLIGFIFVWIRHRIA